MKPALVSFMLAICLVACGSDEGAQGGGGALSCEGDSNLAMLWALVDRGEFLNPAELPTPGTAWVNYIHPTWPLLGFLHPPDWAPTSLGGEQTAGVDLLRNDSGGHYHNIGTWDLRAVPIGAWLDDAIDRSLSLMQASGDPAVLCASPPTRRTVAPGVAQATTAAVVVTDDTVVLGFVSLNGVDGLVGNNVSVNTVGSRRAEFDRIAEEVFFPIYFQLLIGRPPLQDTDQDGTPDVDDAFPLDPTRA